MILDASKVDGDELRCQVCIIGAGPAGISLALELRSAQLDCILVAGGGEEQSEPDRKLHEGEADPEGSHEPLDQNRHRAFGGASKRWGGRLVPFDAIDLERRPFMSLSGWPIPYSELATRFPRAAALCDTPPAEFRQESSSFGFDFPAALANGAIETVTSERWSTPTDFGVRYREVLAACDRTRVLLNSHAVDIRLGPELNRVDHISLASRKSRAIRVVADVFILSAGGLENARILLASRTQITAGLGNNFDWVGRCYMSHVAGTHGSVRIHSHLSKRKPAFYRLNRDRDGVYTRRRFQLSDNAQRELKVGNIIGFPFRPDTRDPVHGDAVLSFLYLQEALSQPDGGSGSGDRPSWSLLARHARNCVFSHPLAWALMAKQIWLRSRQPRLPFILPYSSRAQDALFFQAEHAPNPESRVLLSDRVDEFGIPRIKLRVRFSEIDFRTVIEFYKQLNRGLQSAQLGHLEYDEASLRQYLKLVTTKFNSFSHHMGTTRMALDPRSGVVDENCRVHSVHNLYVAGGSVFPTSGHANPTLTIVALSLRLADHLIAQFSHSQTVKHEENLTRNAG